MIKQVLFTVYGNAQVPADEVNEWVDRLNTFMHKDWTLALYCDGFSSCLYDDTTVDGNLSRSSLINLLHNAPLGLHVDYITLPRYRVHIST